MRSATVVCGPGRKLARTRYATAPRRRSRLAGWIWSGASSWLHEIAPLRAKAAIMRSGRIPFSSAAMGNVTAQALDQTCVHVADDRLDGKPQGALEELYPVVI